MKKFNPFEPNHPIPPGMFTGREEEIDEFLSGLFHTKNKKPSHFLITGERGIGKSSLIKLYKSYADGEKLPPSDDYGTFRFLTVSLTVEDDTDLVTLVSLMMSEIANALTDIETVRSTIEKIKEFLYSLKIANSGIERPAPSTHPAIVKNDFSYHLAETARRLCDAKAGEKAMDGIVFFIDEADNASPKLNLGTFIKTVTEKLQRDGCNNVAFVVAGLPDVTEKLFDSHPSSLRVFTMQKMAVLKPEECDHVIERAIESGNKINKTQTTLSDDAKALITKLSEGYPHFVQQFGHSAYECNSNGVISVDDVKAGALKAIQSIGNRYYEVPYKAKIKSDEYRKVLGVMAKNMNAWVKRSDIKAKSGCSEQSLNNALNFLTSRKIILKNSSRRGEYRLQQQAFALWIRLFGKQNGKRKTQ